MNWLLIAKDTKAKMDSLIAKAKAEKRAFNDEEKAQYENLMKEFDNAIEMDKAEKELEAKNKLFTEPVENNVPHVQVKETRDGQKEFKNLTEQLKAIRDVATTGNVDARERLNKVNNALGAKSGAGEDGGFAVQGDFAGMMLETAVNEDPFLSRVDSYQVSQGSDRVRWVEADESSIATTVFGGVQAYWASEGGSVTASKPTLKEKELKLEKLMGVAYSTYELDSDSNFIDQLYTRAFNTAIRRILAGAVISGDGVGKPIGILNAGSVVSVAKETNQKAGTIVWENLSKMYNRAMSKERGVWLCHPDCAGQFDFLNFPVGTGGVPVYLPAAAAGSIDTLRGKPILESDHCSTLGSKGDIFFVDPSEYILIYKGGVQKDVSIHVQFLTAENCFRFIFRANGMPKRNNALTIKNSSNTRSSIVTLDARA